MNIQQIVGQLERAARVTYEQLLRDVLAPAHMHGTWSQRWWGAVGAFVELFWQGGQEAGNVGFPSVCPNDALDDVGANEAIERLLEEPDGVYRDRLRAPFTTWGASGTIEGIEQQLAVYGMPNCAVYDMAAGWDPGDGNTYSYGRFWVVIDQPHDWSMLVAGEDVIASEELVAGTDGMTQTQYRNLRRIVHKWRSEHSTPVAMYIILSGTLGALSTSAAETMVTAEDAVGLPITWPQAGESMFASDTLYAGWYIEPL